jgi:hypothetical protein
VWGLVLVLGFELVLGLVLLVSIELGLELGL